MCAFGGLGAGTDRRGGMGAGGIEPPAVAVFDAAVPEAGRLAAGLVAGTVPYHLPRAAGLDALAARLDGAPSAGALHLFAHGAPGRVLIGGRWITAESAVTRDAPALARIGAALAPGAAIVLYACRAGAGAEGRALLAALEQATGRRVAASETAVGHAGLGGAWEIAEADATPAPLVVGAETRAAWPHLLGIASDDIPEGGITLDADAGTRISVTSGGQTTITFDLFVEVEDAPAIADVVLLQDLSGSFGDDLDILQAAGFVSGLASNLVSGEGGVSSLAFGVASYVDIPVSPFGDTGDFVYRTDRGLTTVATAGTVDSGGAATVQNTLNGLSTRSGGDGPEAQLIALQQVALRAGSLGFRDDAQGFVVLTTDAGYHEAGDYAAGATNNNDTTLGTDGNGTGEDYPSIGQVSAALTAAGIAPIFAVTASEVATYETLLDELGVGGAVVTLSSNSSNLAGAIKAGLETATVDLSVNESGDSQNLVSVSPASFDDVTPGGAPSRFTVTVTMPDGDFEGTVQLTVPGYGDVFIDFDLDSDTTAPALTAALAAASDSGASDEDGITNVAVPVFALTVDEISTIAMSVGGSGFVTVATGVGPADGTIEIDLADFTLSLEEGDTDIVFRAIDAAGNSTTETVAVTLDTVAPTVSGVLAAASDTGVSGDGITKDAAPLFDVTVSERSELEGALSGGSGILDDAAAGTVEVDLGDAGLALSEGANTVTLRATDLAGNTGTGTASATLDSIAPALTGIARQNPTAEVIAGQTPLGFRAGFSEPVYGVTAARFSVLQDPLSPAISGLTLTDGGDGDTAFDIAIDDADLESFDGTVRVSLAAPGAITDVAGNPVASGGPGEGFTLDSSGPQVLSLDLADDDDLVTNDTTPVIAGIVSDIGPDSDNVTRVVISVGGEEAVTVTTFTPANSVAFSATLPLGALSEGANAITAQGFDSFGNPGPVSTVLSVTLDTTPPEIDDIDRDDPTGEFVANGPLAFAVRFTEAVIGLVNAAFGARGTPEGGGGETLFTSSATVATQMGQGATVTFSAAALAGFDGTIEAFLTATGLASITDIAGNPISGTLPNDAERFTLFSSTPKVVAIGRETPADAVTDADTLVFTVETSRDVTGVSADDFMVTGDGVAEISVTGTGSSYIVTLTGGNLAELDGTVGIAVKAGTDIVDKAGNVLDPTLPAEAASFVLDNPKPPVAADYILTIGEDDLSANLAALLAEADSSILASTVTSVNATGTTGTVSFDAGAQTLTYAADAFDALGPGQTAVDSFGFTLSNEDGSSSATVLVTVEGENDAPAAVDDAVTVGASGPSVIDVLGNDTDIDGDPERFEIVDVTLAAKGFVRIDGGVLRFDPDGDFDTLGTGETETVTVTYVMTDGDGGSDQAAVSITVTGDNAPPSAVGDFAATDAGTPVTIDALANDSDLEDAAGPSLAAIASPPAIGTARIEGGVIVYDPGSAFDTLPLGETERVSFAYRAADSEGLVATATVTVTVRGTFEVPPDPVEPPVEPVTLPPVAANDTATTDEATPVSRDLAANDTDPDGDNPGLSVLSVGPAPEGSVSLSGRTATFDPGTAFADLGPGESRTVAIPYTVADPDGLTDTAFFEVTVTGLNAPPLARDDTLATLPGTPASRDVTANDDDPDGDTVTLVSVGAPTVVSGPALATAAVSVSGNSVAFDPGSDFDGLGAGEVAVLTLPVTVTDGTVERISTLTIRVTGGNQAPSATDDSVSGPASGPIVADVLANDTDPDPGDSLTVAGLGVPTASVPLSTATVTTDGTAVTVDPGTDFAALLPGQTATLSVPYTAADQLGETAGATLTVTVEGVNDAPTPADDAAGTDALTPVTVDVLANDTDPDAGETALLAIEAVGPVLLDGVPVAATAAIVAGGVVIDPAGALAALLPGETGTLTAEVTVADPSGATATSILAITVAGANEGPVAEDDMASFGADETFLAGNVLENDADPEDDPFGVTGLTPIGLEILRAGGATQSLPSLGALEILPGGAFSYAPGAAGPVLAPGDMAFDRYEYTIEDALGRTDTAILTVKWLSGGIDDDLLFDSAIEQRDDNDGQNLIEMTGAVSNDFADGAEGDDLIGGGAGDDTLLGGAGRDEIFGEAGNDRIEGGADDDLLEGGADNDTIEGNAGNDKLLGGPGNDIIDGDTGNDVILGGPGNDLMYGRAGNDVILGDAGNDTIVPGRGTDGVIGGTGVDRFVFEPGDGENLIVDFMAEDRLVLLGFASIDLATALAPTDRGLTFADEGTTIIFQNLFDVSQLTLADIDTVL